eukprot:scaffold314022_cov24-Tisochrysis_lutea.AAC.2
MAARPRTAGILRVNPPRCVEMRQSERTLSAAWAASFIAIMPPIEKPTTWQLSHSIASRSASASRAIISVE